jgi:hypothetical protein
VILADWTHFHGMHWSIHHQEYIMVKLDLTNQCLHICLKMIFPKIDKLRLLPQIPRTKVRPDAAVESTVTEKQSYISTLL